MKPVFKIYLTLVLCIACSSEIKAQLVYSRVDSLNDIQIQLSMEHSQYLLLEPIILNFQITNNSPKPVQLDICTMITSFDVKDSNGKAYHSSGLVDCPLEILHSGESTASAIDVVVHYGTHVDESELSGLPPGTYTIIYDKDIRSNIVEFEVLSPEGADKESYNLLGSALKEQYDKNYESAYQKYKEITEKYPKSYYSAEAMKRQLFLTGWVIRNDDEKLRVSKKLLEEFPDPFICNRAIRNIKTIYQARNKIEEANEYFRKIRAKKSTPQYVQDALDKELE